MSKKTVLPGTRWWAGDNKRFLVLDVVEIEGQTWVHYRDDNRGVAPQEYSCLIESFKQRFSALPE